MQSQLGKVPSSSSKSKSHRLGKSIPLADESKSYSIVSASCSGREPKYGSGCRPPLSYSVRSPFRRCSCAGVVEATSKNVSLVSRSVQLPRHTVLRLCKMLHLASSQLTLLLSRAEHFPESNFMPSPDVHPTMNFMTKHENNTMDATRTHRIKTAIGPLSLSAGWSKSKPSTGLHSINLNTGLQSINPGSCLITSGLVRNRPK